jgi:hypothetical protein
VDADVFQVPPCRNRGPDLVVGNRVEHDDEHVPGTHALGLPGPQEVETTPRADGGCQAGQDCRLENGSSKRERETASQSGPRRSTICSRVLLVLREPDSATTRSGRAPRLSGRDQVADADRTEEIAREACGCLTARASAPVYPGDGADSRLPARPALCGSSRSAR